MESVLIATRQSDYAEQLRDAIQKDFNVTVISSPEENGQLTEKLDLILLDHNFTENSGIDFLMTVLQKSYLPVLILTPDNDHQCAMEALRVGAFNYVVKSGSYLRILSVAIKEAISKFNEREHLKETISALQKKVAKLEKQLNNQTGFTESKAPAEKAPPKPPPKEISLVDEIISRFKRGEINLPAIPQINLQFNKLIKEGASVKDVAELLKQDLAISTKLINISNSAYYRGMTKSKSLEEAINRLGLSTTRQYVEVISNRSLYTVKNKKYVKIMERLWMHSLTCAFAAETVTSILGLRIQHDIFSLGLIHDIGKLVLLQIIGELEAKGKFGRQIAEEDVHKTLGTFHGRFGAVLLKRWAFSEAYIHVALHHDNMEEVENPSPEYLVVHFANLLVRSMGYNLVPEAEIDLEKSPSGYALRIRPEEIETAKEKVTELINEIKNSL